jgi:hypothetical protein
MSKLQKLYDSPRQDSLIFFSNHPDQAVRFDHLEAWHQFLIWQSDELARGTDLGSFEIVTHVNQFLRPREILEQANALHEVIFSNWMCAPGLDRQLTVSLAELERQSQPGSEDFFHVALRAGERQEHWKRADVAIEEKKYVQWQFAVGLYT